MPLASLTPPRDVGPAFADEASPTGFARNFQAGLVYTCGLTAIGNAVAAPDEPEGEEDGPVPTHGRISTIPAEQLSATAGWEDGRYVLRASGVAREVSAFGTNLQLTRRITAVLGESSFRIDDEVENLSSSRASPLMFCYHCNPGFPILNGAESRLDLDSSFSFDTSKVAMLSRFALSVSLTQTYHHFRRP